MLNNATPFGHRLATAYTWHHILVCGSECPEPSFCVCVTFVIYGPTCYLGEDFAIYLAALHTRLASPLHINIMQCGVPSVGMGNCLLLVIAHFALCTFVIAYMLHLLVLVWSQTPKSIMAITSQHLKSYRQSFRAACDVTATLGINNKNASSLSLCESPDFRGP